MKQMNYGFVALKLDARMNELDVSRVGLAARTGFTYETIRKILTAELVPTEEMVHVLCAALDLNFRELSKKASADRALKQLGPEVWRVFGKNPRFAGLYLLSEYLTDRQHEELVEMATLMAEYRRKQRASDFESY